MAWLQSYQLIKVLSQHVLMTVMLKALHEAMLRVFCREAAWLMQAGVRKSG